MADSPSINPAGEAPQTTPNDGHDQTPSSTLPAPQSRATDQVIDPQLRGLSESAPQAATSSFSTQQPASSANPSALIGLTSENGDAPGENDEEQNHAGPQRNDRRLSPFDYDNFFNNDEIFRNEGFFNNGDSFNNGDLTNNGDFSNNRDNNEDVHDSNKHYGNYAGVGPYREGLDRTSGFPDLNGPDFFITRNHYQPSADLFTFPQQYDPPRSGNLPLSYAPASDDVAHLNPFRHPQASLPPATLGMQPYNGAIAHLSSYPNSDTQHPLVPPQPGTPPAAYFQDRPNDRLIDPDFDDVEDGEKDPEDEAKVLDAPKPKAKAGEKRKRETLQDYARKATYPPILLKDAKNPDGSWKYQEDDRGVLQFPRAARGTSRLFWTPYHPDKNLFLHQIGYFTGRGGNKTRSMLADEMLNRPTDENRKVYIDVAAKNYARNILLKAEDRFFKQFLQENLPENHPSSVEELVAERKKLMKSEDFLEKHQRGYLTARGFDWNPWDTHDDSFDADNELRVKEKSVTQPTKKELKPKGSKPKESKRKVKKPKAPSTSSGADQSAFNQALENDTLRSHYRPLASNQGYHMGPAYPNYPPAAAGQHAYGGHYGNPGAGTAPLMPSYYLGYPYGLPQNNNYLPPGNPYGHGVTPFGDGMGYRYPGGHDNDAADEEAGRALKKQKSSNTNTIHGHTGSQQQPPPSSASQSSYPDPAYMTQHDHVYWNRRAQYYDQRSNQGNSYTSARNASASGNPGPIELQQPTPNNSVDASRLDAEISRHTSSATPSSGNGDSTRTPPSSDEAQGQTSSSATPSSLTDSMASIKRKRDGENADSDEDARAHKAAKTTDERTSPAPNAFSGAGRRRIARPTTARPSPAAASCNASQQVSISNLEAANSSPAGQQQQAGVPPTQLPVDTQVRQFDRVAAALLSQGSSRPFRGITSHDLYILDTVVGNHTLASFYHTYLINIPNDLPQHVYQVRFAYYSARYLGHAPT